MKKVGLYFGSFNPIHHGHLIVADTLLGSSDLDEVWFVITPKSPDKTGMDLLCHNKRYDMLEKVIKDNPKLQISTIEFGMEQPNYTHKTLEKLRLENPTNEFVVIMGSDNANNLQQWVGIDEWRHHHKLYVVERPLNYLEHGSLRWYGEGNYKIFEIPEINISSTMIRGNIKSGKSIKYLVPNNIINDITKNYG
jgi:nicotinate-nucleotide adenylyltransferase